MIHLKSIPAARGATALILGLGTTLGTISVATATTPTNSYLEAHEFASAKSAPFEYEKSLQGGYVLAVTASSVTVARWNGVTTTYTITPRTTFRQGGMAATIADLVVGDRVSVVVSSARKTTALKIKIEFAELAGKVTSVSGNLITITGGEGFSRTILVGPSTTYRESGVAVPLASVTVGAALRARGTVDANRTTLDALYVTIGHSETVRGVVSSATASSVTINRLNGTTTTYALLSTTVVVAGRHVVSAQQLVAGEKLSVVTNSAAPATAFHIRIALSELAGKVTAVSGNTITITTGQGFSRAVLVGALTSYAMAGLAVTLANVTVGSTISVQGLVDANLTTLDALKITIRGTGQIETFHGTVTALGTSSVTVTLLSGPAATFALTSATIYTDGSVVLNSASLAIGDLVGVRVNSLAPTTALTISLEVATLSGIVTNVAGTTITITTSQGFSRVIVVSSTTTYTKADTPATLADVTVGAKIRAQGSVDANGTSLDARSVTIS